MNKLTLRFVRASLVYFIIGMILGMYLVFWPKWPGVMRVVHVHVNLFGWVAMLIYAAGYTLLPRLVDKPLFSQRLAEFQYYLSNGALVAMIVFWITVAFQSPGTLAYAFSYAMFSISTILAALGGILFVYNLLMTMRDG